MREVLQPTRRRVAIFIRKAIKRKQEMADKAKIIQELSLIFKKTHRFKNLDELSYHQEDGQEFVLAEFKDGRTHRLCVSNESPEKMVESVLVWLVSYELTELCQQPKHGSRLEVIGKVSMIAFIAVIALGIAFFIVPNEAKGFIAAIQAATLAVQIISTGYYLIGSTLQEKRERAGRIKTIHAAEEVDGYIAIELDPEEDADDLGIKDQTFSTTEAETLKKAKKLVGEADEKMSKEEFEAKYKMEITECTRSQTML